MVLPVLSFISSHAQNRAIKVIAQLQLRAFLLSFQISNRHLTLSTEQCLLDIEQICILSCV